MARIAEEDGASGLMMLPPMRYKADDRETVTYFRKVAQSTALPIMIYNNPVDPAQSIHRLELGLILGEQIMAADGLANEYRDMVFLLTHGALPEYAIPS